MPTRRLVDPAKTITLHVDGRDVPAVAGEPVAVALVATGRTLLARSVKYHRPRGPACFAGRCDGCLMRIDGIANVMTCRAPARDGMHVETQNVLGSAESDLLAATDWFFPGGMNHHEMFTANKLVNRAMQKVARRIAGIGELPTRLVPSTPPREVACDVLVIGGGAPGLAAATEAARGGATTVLLEEAPETGGQLLVFPGGVIDERGREQNAPTVADALLREAEAAGVRVLTRHAAIGVYGAEVLAHAKDHVVRVSFGRLVVATGSHEGAMAFEGADLPGVMGVRAACVLLRHGVLPGERIAIVGTGLWSDALAAALRARRAEVLGPFAAEAARRARGRPSVRALDVHRVAGAADLGHRRDGERSDVETIVCDGVAIAPPPSPAYELAEQAGAAVAFSGEAFVVTASAQDGQTAAPGVYAVGECAGVRDLRAALAQGRAAGHAAAVHVGEGARRGG